MLEAFLHQSFDKTNDKSLSEIHIDNRLLTTLKQHCSRHFLSAQLLDIFVASYFIKQAKAEAT